MTDRSLKWANKTLRKQKKKKKNRRTRDRGSHRVGANQALAIFAAGRADFADAFEHHALGGSGNWALPGPNISPGRMPADPHIHNRCADPGMLPSLSQIADRTFFARKWTRFAWEARQSASIGTNTAGQDVTLRQPALAFAEIAKA